MVISKVLFISYHMNHMYQEEAGDVELRFKGKRQGEKEKVSRARHREILTIKLNKN